MNDFGYMFCFLNYANIFHRFTAGAKKLVATLLSTHCKKAKRKKLHLLMTPIHFGLRSKKPWTNRKIAKKTLFTTNNSSELKILNISFQEKACSSRFVCEIAFNKLILSANSHRSEIIANVIFFKRLHRADI